MENSGARHFKYLIILAAVIFVALFFAFNSTKLSGNAVFEGGTYYVGLSGSDSNAGTASDPWRTIQHAADSVVPGATVVVTAGDYRDQGRILLRVSGEVNNLITFQTQGDVKTKGFGVFSASAGPTDYVKIKGFEISDTANDAINGPGIIVQGKGIVIEGNEIHDVSKEGIWLFIQYDGNANPDLSTTSACRVENNIIQNSGADGIRIYGEKNEIINNEIKNNLGIGISSLNAAENKMYNNKIYNNFQQGIHLAHSSGAIIQDNEIYENCLNYDDCFGIDIIGIGDNNIVRYNKVHSQHDTVADTSVAPRYGGTSKYGTGGIRFDGDYNGDLATSTNSNGNIIHTNLVYGEYEGIQIINFGNSKIYNNNILNSKLYGILVMAQPSGGVTKNTIIKNNIISGSDGYLIYNYGAEDNIIDHNIYFNSNVNSFNWNGQVADFTFWKTYSESDLNSNFTNPLLGTDMLQLDSESPAINSGVDVGLSRDFIGTSVPQSESFDIGATESEAVPEIEPPIEEPVNNISECGNTIVEEGESCDLNNLSGKTCVSLGYDSGVLRCNELCQLDSSLCINECEDLDQDGFSENSCGGEDCSDNNNKINPSSAEICDGIDNNCNGVVDENADASCSVLGNGYRCSSGKCCITTGSWFWKKTICTDISDVDVEPEELEESEGPINNCGNALIDNGEECDASNLNGKTCVSQGYNSGNLLCGSDCKLDDSSCKNGCVSTAEICDGVDNNCNGVVDDGADASCSVLGNGYRCSSGKCCVTTGRWFWKKTTCRTLSN